MVRKGMLFYTMVFCCLFALGSFNPLWAAESDSARLIELLKSKNIISQQEADVLLKEVKESAKKEQKELEEIKTTAKAATLPASLKGFKFSSTLFAEWNSRNPEAGASTNDFRLGRTYISLSKEINDWLAMNITADLFTSMDPDDNTTTKGNGLELRVKNAYIAMKFKGTETRVGMIGTPSESYDGSIWPLRVQGMNLWDDLSIQPSTDYGVSNQGVFGGYMDEEYLKIASKPFAGKWGGYNIGIFNGSGYNVSEANNNKVIAGVIYFRPLPSMPVLKGLQLAYAGTSGKSNANFSTAAATAAGKSTTDYPDCTSNSVQASLQHKIFTVMGQYYWGKSAAKATDEYDRKAYLVEAFVKVPGLEKSKVFGRYLHFDPNTDLDNDDWNRVTAGVAYDVSKEFMPFVAFEKKSFDTTSATNIDYDQYQVGFQLKF